MPQPSLEKIQDISNHKFSVPKKRIHDGVDVSFFSTSLAYRDIITFIFQLNRSVLPRKSVVNGKETIQTWQLDTFRNFSKPIQNLRSMLTKLQDLISEAPPDTGPRRFGNVSFRKWYKLVEDRIRGIVKDYLPAEMEPAFDELEAYLLGSFGSPQRLDYGTGHELSFIAFLASLWKLHFFAESEPGVEERSIVLGVFEPYLTLARTLIKTYTLEPAGSHGVWGLDDNSFLPYVFGSAQLCPAIEENDDTPTEGSITDAPEPGSVAKSNLVDKEKKQNMYFSAVAFIYEVKKGPFWEHSPMLYDISGIKDGWGKINKGMLKMYDAEVLSKFPVVQHFPFGSLLLWERDPDAKVLPNKSSSNAGQQQQQLRDPNITTSTVRPGNLMSGNMGSRHINSLPQTNIPSAAPIGFVDGVTKAPWASQPREPPSRRPNVNLASRRPIPKIQEQNELPKSDEHIQ